MPNHHSLGVGNCSPSLVAAGMQSQDGMLVNLSLLSFVSVVSQLVLICLAYCNLFPS